MPWKMSDAIRHTDKAKSLREKRKWSSTANAVLEKFGDEGKAIRIANSAVKKSKGKNKSKPYLGRSHSV